MVPLPFGRNFYFSILIYGSNMASIQNQNMQLQTINNTQLTTGYFLLYIFRYTSINRIGYAIIAQRDNIENIENILIF